MQTAQTVLAKRVNLNPHIIELRATTESRLLGLILEEDPFQAMSFSPEQTMEHVNKIVNCNKNGITNICDILAVRF